MLIKIGCTCMCVCVCIRRAHVKLIQTGFLLNNFNRNVLLNNILHIQVSTTIHERLRQQKNKISAKGYCTWRYLCVRSIKCNCIFVCL